MAVQTTQAQCESAGSVGAAIVGEDDHDFAVLQISESGGSIAVSIEVSSGLAVLGVEAQVCAVIDLNQSAVLIQNHNCAVAVGGESAGVLLVEDDHAVLSSILGANLGVVQPLAFFGSDLTVTDGDGGLLGFESQTQAGDLQADLSAAIQEAAVGISAANVGSSDHGLAVLQRSQSLTQIAGGGALFGILDAQFGSGSIEVLAADAVINTDDRAKFIHNDGYAVTIVKVDACGVILGVDQQSHAGNTGQILVNKHHVHVDIELVLTDLQNANAVRLDLDLTSKLGGQLAVGDAQGNSVQAGNVHIEATVVHQGDLLDGHIVSGIESAVVVIDYQTSLHNSFHIEAGVAQLSQDLVIARNGGLLVHVSSQLFVGVHPEQADHVAVGADDIVAQEATAVKVEAGAESASLHNDGKTAGRNGHNLSKVLCNQNVLAIHHDGSGARSAGTRGVLLVHQLAVCAVAAFDDHAVGSNDCSNTAATVDADNDILIGGVVEHAGQLLIGGEISIQLHILVVGKAQQLACGPLLIAQDVLQNFHSDVGLSSQHDNGTGSSYLHIAQSCLVGDGVGAGSGLVEITGIGDTQGSICIVDGYAKHQVVIIACVDLNGVGSDRNGQLTSGISLGGCVVAATSAQHQSQHEHQGHHNAHDLLGSLHNFLLKFFIF